MIWISPGKQCWLSDVEAHERANPDVYPEAVGWDIAPEQRAELLFERWRKSRRQFIRLSKQYPADCMEILLTKDDLDKRIEDLFSRRNASGPAATT